MFDDPHLLASDGLGSVVLTDGTQTKLPNLPLEMSGRRPTRGGTLPQIGENTAELLADLGLSNEQVASLAGAGVIGVSK
jgi:crotonobetainyl-CoA:carnitine CoA-transferase CaiB-like acyl-CoA transferase